MPRIPDAAPSRARNSCAKARVATRGWWHINCRLRGHDYYTSYYDPDTETSFGVLNPDFGQASRFSLAQLETPRALRVGVRFEF